MTKQDTRTAKIVSEMVTELVKNHGYAYAAGYLETTIVQLIAKHVKGEDLTELMFQMIDKTVDERWNKKAA